jgi:hypothetical protein
MSDATRILDLLTQAEDAAHDCLGAAYDSGIYYGNMGFDDPEAIKKENVTLDRMQKAFVDLRAALEVQS